MPDHPEDRKGSTTYGAISSPSASNAAGSGDDAGSASGGDDDKAKVKMFASRRDKLVFLCLALNNLFVSVCFATMAPFFPSVAAAKSPGYVTPTPEIPIGNASTSAPVTPTLDTTTSTLIGMVFSVATFTDFLFSPLVGRELPSVGPKLVFLIGCTLVSGVTILFAFVDLIDDWTTFLAMCYALRMVQGIGTACMFTASFTILAGAFPKSVGTVTGSLEVFSGVGFMIGPAIGGGLYASGGFKLPFLVSGAVLCMSTVLVGLVLPPPPPRPKQEKISLLTILKQPRAWLMIPTALICASALGFLDPSLGPFLHNEFRLSPSKIGLVFLIGPGVYAVLALLSGYIGDRWSTRPLVPFGLLCTGLSYQLLGPCPLLPWQPLEARTLGSLALLGVGIAFGLVPTSPDMLVSLREAGFKDSIELHSSLGGVIGAAFSLGEGLGPSVGGLMTGAVGFAEAAAIFGAMIMSLSVIVTAGTLLGLVWKRKPAAVGVVETEPGLNVQEEAAALLDSTS